MHRKALAVASASLFTFLAAMPLVAQNSTPPANPPGQNRPGGRGGQPCWQQAGIEKSVMEQRWAVERDTKSQVSAVCSNTSLTPQQKQQQARELHQQGRQKMEGLVTPEQEKALSACQQERGMGHGGQHEMGGGCNEWSRQGQGQGQRQGPQNGASGGTPQSPQN